MFQSIKENREKVRKFVESKSFDLFIMVLICFDALVLGLMTSDDFSVYFDNVLFILDKLCMAIFIVEMILKLYVYGTKFFKSGWNTFDFSVIMISSFSFAGYFIILRTFRLFRLLKYINRFSKLKKILDVLGALLPNFIAMMSVFAVFLYVFAIMATSLFGEVFTEFSTLGGSLFSLLQVFTLDGWASEVARPIMTVFPHSWIFFVTFIVFSFLLMISFIMSVIDEIFRRDILREISEDCRIDTSQTLPEKKNFTKKKTTPHKRRMSPAKLAK